MARHRIPLAIAAAVFTLANLAGTASADDRSARSTPADPVIPSTEAAPLGTDCRVIDFKSARVHTSPTVPSRYVLVVRGEKPYLNMQVKLIPLDIVYIRAPEYWGIEVVGCLPEVGLPAVGTYVAKLELNGPMGTRGIEVIGANHSEKINIPGIRPWPWGA